MANASRSNAPGITHLPNEVLLTILSYLEKPWLKDIRLVNRSFATLSARYLFDTAVFSPHKVDIADYLSIANHPVFCHYVKTIVYCVARFQDVMCFVDYEDLAEKTKPHTTHDTHALRAGYWEWSRVQEEERRCWESGEAPASMYAGLTKFSHLQHLAISESWMCEWLLGEQRPSRGPGRLCREWNDDFAEPMLTLDEEFPLTYNSATFSLLALSISQCVIHEITSYETTWWFWTRAWVELLDSHVPRFSSLFERLCVLRIWFKDITFSETWFQARRLIRIAQAVEKLSLTGNTNQSALIPFDRLVEENTWPRLRSLTISCAEMSETALTAFFVAHAPTLRTFDMCQTHLTEGRWVTVVTHMREVLRLQECHLFVKIDKNGVIIDRTWRFSPKREHLDLGEYVIRGGAIPSKLVGPETNAEVSESE